MSSAAPRQRTFLGHPIGLYVLFLTEMWERFNYYGMRALLILYMVNYFRWSTEDGASVYKWYTSLVYLTPLLGGYLADRFLGNRAAVIIGASMLACGQFLMTFDSKTIFSLALVVLVIGNGIFKPNISTQVGRLYPTNDPRRDGGYTIFYMGINVGAGLAPLVTGWLLENTVGAYHAGFMACCVGMIFGLIIYILGQPLVHELKQNEAEPPRGAETAAEPAGAERPLSEAEAERTPSAVGPVGSFWPGLLLALGVGGLLAGGVALVAGSGINLAFEFASVGLSSLLIGLVARQLHGGLRDRVLSILALGIFVVFFWGAYEQAGSSLTLWADKNTDRYLTQPVQAEPFPEEPPPLTTTSAETSTPHRGLGLWEHFTTMFQLKKTEQKKDESSGPWFQKSLNPVPTAWFQSINAVLIVLLAPPIAWFWVWLARHGHDLSIPTKMFFGLVFMALSMAAMIAAAKMENRPASIQLSNGLPPELKTNDKGQVLRPPDDEGRVRPFDGGRLFYDAGTKTLRLTGALADTERDRLVSATAPPTFVQQIDELQKKRAASGDQPASVVLTVPPGFDLRYAGMHHLTGEGTWKRNELTYDPATRTLTAVKTLAVRETQALKLAAAAPTFRSQVGELFRESVPHRVSPWWLVLSYFLATIGELCLSPVGLSMVSKLAPARFATMLMGLWFLTSFFGNFVAGTMGEIYDTMPPVQFFMLSTVAVGGASVVLLVLVKLITRLMHGVR